jgi:hypothetical protein
MKYVIHAIEKAKYELRCKNIIPSKVYLGFDEERALANENQVFISYEVIEKNTICGLDLHIVNEKSHFNVC